MTNRLSLQRSAFGHAKALGVLLAVSAVLLLLAAARRPAAEMARETGPRLVGVEPLLRAEAALPAPPALLGVLPLDIGPMLRSLQSGEVAAAPFVLRASNRAERNRALQCLATAIYYEAGDEPLDGQRAVAQVVINRVRAPGFPHSVCGVVYQGADRATGCQFSFTCDGSLARGPDPARYAKAYAVAERALTGYVMDAVGAATHYHAADVDPWWRSSVVRIAQVGSQIFYRWSGGAGQLAAFTQPYRGGELEVAEPAIDPRGSPLALASAWSPRANPVLLGRTNGGASVGQTPNARAAAKAAIMPPPS